MVRRAARPAAGCGAAAGLPALSGGKTQLANGAQIFSGGYPIYRGNTLVGAIGISGTPGAKGGGTADEGCARAAIDKIAGGLK